MKNKLLIVILVISLGINFGFFFSYAYYSLNGNKNVSDTNMPRCMPSWSNSPIHKKLNLNIEQLKIFEKYHNEIQSEIMSIREKIKQNRTEIFFLLKKQKIDDIKLDRLLTDISIMQLEIEKKVIKHIIKVRTELTPDQRNKFDDFFEQGFCPIK